MKRILHFILLLALICLLSATSTLGAASSNLPTITPNIRVPALLLGTPSNLKVTTFPGVLQVSLQWTDSVSNETGFVIERSTNGGSFAQIGQVGAGVCEYNDLNVTNDMSCKYRVYAIGSTGKSGYSNEVAWVTLGNDPSNLTGEIDGLTQNIILKWDGNNKYCSYQIQKSVGNGMATSSVEIINLPAGSNSYTDKNITAPNIYSYFVMAISPAGRSHGSNTVTLNYLPAPSKVQVIYFSGTKVLTVKWQDNSVNETKYVIEKAHSNQGPVYIYEAPANSTEYQDGVTFDKLHMYRIKAIAPNGEPSPYSEVCYWYAPPRIPGNFSAEALSGSEVKLTWLDQSEIETGFKIWRKSDKEAVAIDVPANTSEYIDKGLKAATKYSYSICAINSQSNTKSDDYPPVSVTTQTGLIISGDFSKLPGNALPIGKLDTVLQIGNTKMTVNGVEQELDPGHGTAPIIINGSTMLPIRAIVDVYGGTLEWDGTARKVIVKCNGQTLELWIDKAEAKVNGVSKSSSVAPMIMNGRTMLPLRFVSENLGLGVTWDPTQQRVTIKVAE